MTVWPVFDNYTLTYYGAESDAYALALSPLKQQKQIL